MAQINVSGLLNTSRKALFESPKHLSFEDFGFHQKGWNSVTHPKVEISPTYMSYTIILWHPD